MQPAASAIRWQRRSVPPLHCASTCSMAVLHSAAGLQERLSALAAFSPKLDPSIDSYVCVPFPEGFTSL